MWKKWAGGVVGGRAATKQGTGRIAHSVERRHENGQVLQGVCGVCAVSWSPSVQSVCGTAHAQQCHKVCVCRGRE